MITKNDFSGLTILSYPRGQMGEFFAIMLYAKNYLEIDNDMSLLYAGNNQFSAYKIDRAFNSLVYTRDLESANCILERHFYNETLYNLIKNKEYDLAKTCFLQFINLAETLNFDYNVFSNLVARKEFDKISVFFKDSPYNGKIITRSHNYDQLDFTECFNNCNHINFYALQEKQWVFTCLYFIKKIKNREFEKSIWLFKRFEDIWDYVNNYNKNKESQIIKNAYNINVYDILTGKNIPEIFVKDDSSIQKIKKYCESNINLLEDFRLDHTIDNYDSQELYEIFNEYYKRNIRK